MGRLAKDPGFRALLNGEPLVRPWPAGKDSNAADVHCLAPADDTESNLIQLDWQDAEDLLGHSRGWPRDRVLKFRYLVLGPKQGTVEPAEFRGVLLRLRKVALGLPLPFNRLPNVHNLRHERRSAWEIHLIEGFDDQLTLDRTTLKDNVQLATLTAYLARRAEAPDPAPPVEVKARPTTAERRQPRRTSRDEAPPRPTTAPLFKRVGQTTQALARLDRLKRQLESDDSHLPLSDALADIEALTDDLGFELVRTDALPAGTLEVDHDRRQVRVSTRERATTIELDGLVFSLAVVSDRLTTRPGHRWISLNQKTRELRVSEGLRALIRGETSLKYRQLLPRLARVELRRVQAIEETDSNAVTRAINRLADLIKDDLVEDSR